MAQKVIRETICDITGEPAVITMTFGLEGRQYEIDLAGEPAEELRSSLAGFIESARPLKGVTKRGAMNGSNVRTSREQTQAIRDWARQNGHNVSDRGRISAEVQKAFADAH